MDTEVAAIIEQAAERYYGCALESSEQVRSEVNNLLQWQIAVVAGGLGLFGVFSVDGISALRVAAIVVVFVTAFDAKRLLKCLRSREIPAQGKSCRDVEQVRWRTPCTFAIPVRARNR